MSPKKQTKFHRKQKEQRLFKGGCLAECFSDTSSPERDCKKETFKRKKQEMSNPSRNEPQQGGPKRSRFLKDSSEDTKEKKRKPACARKIDFENLGDDDRKTSSPDENGMTYIGHVVQMRKRSSEVEPIKNDSSDSTDDEEIMEFDCVAGIESLRISSPEPTDGNANVAVDSPAIVEVEFDDFNNNMIMETSIGGGEPCHECERVQLHNDLQDFLDIMIDNIING